MYCEEDLVRIAKRENNKLRNYLVVNRLQGKHIPGRPSQAMEMFEKLADTLREEYKGERLLLVGFAETATAIGAAVAVSLGTKYIQTTREVIPHVDYIFFSEEHSHATEQKLVKDDMDLCMEEVDRIVFVEDEVTTGKTILNIIDRLEQLYPGRVSYCVASLLNGMDEAALQRYADRGIALHYLVKTNHADYDAVADKYAGDGTYIPCDAERKQTVTTLRVEGAVNARRLVDAIAYREACEGLCSRVEEALQGHLSGKVLVIGTEEFMYPALFVAEGIEKKGAMVSCHSTTRSPIAVSSEAEYPLHVRYELRSMYDEERITFLYDIGTYDTVVVLTDAVTKQPRGVNSLINALAQQNKKIFLIRWC